MGNLISVITLTYTNFNHLKETILSVCAQDYHDIEYIICDDGSEQFPEEQIVGWIENHRGSNLKQYKIFRQAENVGTVRNINYAYRHASGDFFINLSCGDVFFETHTVSKIADRMCSSNAKMMLTSRVMYKGTFEPVGLVPHYHDRDKLNKITSREEQYHEFIKTALYGIASGCVLCSTRAMMEELEFFDERYILWEDGPLFAKYLKKYRLEYYPELISIWYEQGGVSTGGIKKQSPILQKDTMLFNKNEGIGVQNFLTPYEKERKKFMKARWEAETKGQIICCYVRYPIQAVLFFGKKLKDRFMRIIDKLVIKKAMAEREQTAVEGC